MAEDKTLVIAYIVRHGQTRFNVEGITQGHSDSELTEDGIRQAQLLNERFKGIHFDAVFSSDLLRAQATAKIITLERELPINTSELLRERKYGQFEGQHSRVFREGNKELLESLKTLSRSGRWTLKFADDIESDEEICNRLVSFLGETTPAHFGKTVLVVTHGGIMRAFLNYLKWGGSDELPSGAVQNTAYIKLLSDGTDFTIEHVDGVKR